jgi:hypothetical protein
MARVHTVHDAGHVEIRVGYIDTVVDHSHVHVDALVDPVDLRRRAL